MKKGFNPNIFPWFTVGSGGLGLALGSWFTAGTDQKGLLPAQHPALPMIYILMALVLAVIFLCCRQLTPIAKYSRLFPAGKGRAAGCAIGAAGVLYAGICYLGGDNGILGIATFVSGLAAAAAMGLMAFFRLKGARPTVVLHTVLTVFFMLFTVCNCRVWGAEPQIQSYIFPLFACVFLMLTGYHMTVLDVRKGGRRWLIFSNQAALFFCCLSLTGASRFFYLSMIIWLALDLCSVEKGQIVQPPEEA